MNTRTSPCRLCGGRTDQLDPGGRPAHGWCRRRHLSECQIRRLVEVEEAPEDGLVSIGHLHDCSICGDSTWLVLPDGPPMHRRCLRRLYLEDQHLGFGSLAGVVERYLRYGYTIGKDLDRCLVCSGLTFMREQSMGGAAHLACWVS